LAPCDRVIALGATNRIAKSYIENVFIWNSWPILYGGFGALLSAVQMGQVGQMLARIVFLVAWEISKVHSLSELPALSIRWQLRSFRSLPSELSAATLGPLPLHWWAQR